MDIEGIWEPVLAGRLLSLYESLQRMVVVGLAGVPGSGKTASAAMLGRAVRERLPQGGKACVVVPMDGFHYYKRELDQFQDPGEAHFRRGAQFTFNASAMLLKLKSLCSGHATSFPSFSHTTGDPIEDTILVDPSTTAVVIFEGLYLLLEEPVWKEVRSTLDLKVYLECSLDEAMERTYSRNCRCLPYPPEVVRDRIERNDRVNGVEVQSSKQYADVVVHFYWKSAEDLEGLE